MFASARKGWIMVTIKTKYQGKKFAGPSYTKPVWDDVYLNGRAGEDPMEYDCARTSCVNYNWRGLSVGMGERSRVARAYEKVVLA